MRGLAVQGTLAALAFAAGLVGCGSDGASPPVAAAGSAAGGSAGAGGGAMSGSGTAGSGLALGGGGAGGGASTRDEYGCDLATQVSCHGECFGAVGEEKSGCRLLRFVPSPGGSKIAELAVDGTDLFYAGVSGLRAIRLTSMADELVADKPKYVSSIVPAGDFVYVTTSASDSGTFGPGTVQRAPRAGGVVTPLVAGVTGPFNLTILEPNAYFSIGFGTLYSTPVAGGVEPVKTTVNAHALLADGPDLVYAIAGVTNFPIMVATGGDFATAVEVVPETFDPTLITVLDGKIYWFDDDGNYQRVPKTGGTPETVKPTTAGYGPWRHSQSDILSSVTTAGKSTVSALPIAGGEWTEIGKFSASAETATSNATHYFVALGAHGAIFQITR